MPEFPFRLSRDEKNEFCRLIIDKECIVVPDLKYKQHEYNTTNNIEEMMKLCDEYVGFYITHKSFQKYPLKISDGVNNPYFGFFYSIVARIGGPCIHLDNFSYKENLTQIKISPDILHHYPDYWKEDLSWNFKAPEELKILYKEFVNYIRKRTKPFKLLLKDGKSYRTFYISKLLIDEANNKGKKLILWDNVLPI